MINFLAFLIFILLLKEVLFVIILDRKKSAIYCIMAIELAAIFALAIINAMITGGAG